MTTARQPWDAVLDRVRTEYRIDWVYPPKPTATELDAVEAELGCRFPVSYREFAERFGLDGEIHILPQMLRLRTVEGSSWSVVTATQEFQTNPGGWWNYRDADLPLFRRMIAFAEDGGYDKFVFDPAEVTDPDCHEMRIYAIDKSAQIEPVGDSFPAFLKYLHDRYYYDPADDYEPGAYVDELLPWKVFKPETSDPDPIPYVRNPIREKVTPNHATVAPWLAFNNNAARDLAHSIRDGHPEAFPVVADALEEAGCTNADLLDSCRRGDPDIDGVWVLRVLLGEG